MFKVFSSDAATKTHGAVDGNLMDLVNPFSFPADTATAVAKTAAVAAIAWVGRGYKENKTFGF